ncbi:MAG: hypothetical protein SOY69_01020, partial [Alloprevotella sp.]|nr:hypothetical protein [Alloprevotella sp.]
PPGRPDSPAPPDACRHPDSNSPYLTLLKQAGRTAQISPLIYEKKRAAVAEGTEKVLTFHYRGTFSVPSIKASHFQPFADHSRSKNIHKNTRKTPFQPQKIKKPNI